MKTIDTKQLVAAVRKVAAEKPDYHYRQENAFCTYFKRAGDEQFVPSCLVGHGLAAVGVTPDELIKDDSFVVSGANTVSVEGLASDPDSGLKFTDVGTAMSWLMKAQGVQDDDGTWGEAVRAADEEFPLKDGE